jgi:hypothetical protein
VVVVDGAGLWSGYKAEMLSHRACMQWLWNYTICASAIRLEENGTSVEEHRGRNHFVVMVAYEGAGDY